MNMPAITNPFAKPAQQPQFSGKISDTVNQLKETILEAKPDVFQKSSAVAQ